MEIKIILVILCYILSCYGDYLNKRANLLEEDNRHQIGNDIILSDNENKVDQLLRRMKQKELDVSFNTSRSLQEINFLLAEEEISKSDVFKFIQKIPKGAINHIHDMALTGYLPLIKKWTYDKHLYTCYNTILKTYSYLFSKTQPPDEISCKWISVNQARNNYGNDDAFDKLLLSNFTLTKDFLLNAKDQNDIWTKFQNGFISFNGIFSYKAVFMDYLSMGLKALMEDGVQFVEIRATLPLLYDLDGTYANPEYALKLYIDMAKEFKLRYKTDFAGLKVIYCMLRRLPTDKIKEAVSKSVLFHQKYPEYFAGFDLVGQEDTGKPLLFYVDELLAPMKNHQHLPYIFHAGETDWQGNSVDENLFDAVLLNSTRIGHGFALNKHPYLKKIAKAKEVAVELCPISNQVLGLVTDLRDHPGASLLAENYPVTVSSDDPGMWGASGLSHDLYQVLMGMVPKDGGLKVLKKLFLNSIKFSSTDATEKKILTDMWGRKWDAFITATILDYQL